MFTLFIRRSGAIVVPRCILPVAACCGASNLAAMMTTVAQSHTLRCRSSNNILPLSQRNGSGSKNHGGGTSHASNGNSINSTSSSQSTVVHSNSNGSGSNGAATLVLLAHSSDNVNKGGGGGGGNNGRSNSGNDFSSLKRKQRINKVLKRTVILKKRRQMNPTALSTSIPSGNTVAGGGGGTSTSRSASNGVSSLSSSVADSASGSSTLCRQKKRKILAEKLKSPSPRLRVCVLNSTYEGSDSVTAEVDNYHCSPEYWVKKEKKRYVFTDVAVRKDDSYRQVRELVTSNKYDVFFNLCDGGRDERRAGVDVVEALEEHNAAFTGTNSRSFEPSKIDMKLFVGAAGVNTPNFVLLENTEGLAKKCRHLRFPVIVKHLSGYASVGIQKDNRCDNLDELKSKVQSFLKEYNHALVEEFIRGREGTVLTCADSSSPFGVKVFKPLMFKFLQNDDDFAYFEKKWTMECNNEAYDFMPHNDPAYPLIVDMARNAFRHIMNGVGYGRVDFRIDLKGDVYFLEINPNCGMWYDEKDGGDFADLMVQGDKSWDHERFIRNAVFRAVREQAARRPWYFISHDSKGNFSTRASKKVRAGKSLFSDTTHPIPIVAQALYKLGEENPTVGCVILRGDRLHQAVAIRHSCEPNMQFMQGCTLTLVAKRTINVGEELTVDYATLCDENMPPFACSCGTSNCRSVIFPSPPTPRTMEGKYVRRLLREKKKAWYKEKEDREAERMLKKRALKSKGNSLTSFSSSSTSSPPVSSSSSSLVTGNSSASVNGTSLNNSGNTTSNTSARK